MTRSLLETWRAIPSASSGAGWQMIGIFPEAACPISAAMRFPETLEAVAIEVTADLISPSTKLPQAHGFQVVVERRSPGPRGLILVILQRTALGSLDLFSQIAEDASAVAAREASTLSALRAFLARINAWMKFADHARTALSDEEEVGLIGELATLDRLLDTLDGEILVASWLGPCKGIHDFVFGQVALEVKTTVGTSEAVHIFDLDQLDKKMLDGLFLARVKLRRDDGGWALGQWANHVTQKAGNAAAEIVNKLMLAGVAPSNFETFTKRFTVEGIDAFEVNGAFPKLTPNNVPLGVGRVSYWIDLRAAKEFEISVEVAISRIMGTNHVV